MFKNIFWFDRILRSALGSTMLTLAFHSSDPVLYIVGGALLITGALGFCPIHAVAGANEAEQKKTSQYKTFRDAA